MPKSARRFLLAFLVLLAPGLVLVMGGCQGTTDEAQSVPQANGNSYLFCFWNTENLFDDKEDGRASKADQEYDRWFARDPAALKLKYAHLSEALVKLNDGKGPDILAVVELESVRSAELLQEAFNARLADKALHYQHILMKEVKGGRHIAPAILTRLPVRGDKTRLHGRLLRILEGHIEVNGHDLVIIASHWTSRLSDKEGKEGTGRAKYGDQIYGVYKGMVKSNPDVDFLVCGDFNDPPDAPSVTRHLHATEDRAAVLRSREEPLLLDLFADKDPAQFGTHYHAGKWYVFDQIAVSPGLLDNAGWRCDPSSVQTINSLYRPSDRQRRPWRFGNEHDKAIRGYSDHFPVTVRLEVAGK